MIHYIMCKSKAILYKEIRAVNKDYPKQAGTRPPKTQKYKKYKNCLVY